MTTTQEAKKRLEHMAVYSSHNRHIQVPRLITDMHEHIELLHRNSHPAAYINIFHAAAEDKKKFFSKQVSKADTWDDVYALDNEKDVYIAINPLFQYYRKNSNISNYNWLFVDIDKPQDAPADWLYDVSEKIERDIFAAGRFIEPSVRVNSGTGMWYMWRLDGKASTQHSEEHILWHALMHHIGDIFAPYGADRAVKDQARIMRLAGSVNSKSNQRVSLVEYSTEENNLREITERYLGDTEAILRAQTPTKRTKAKKNTSPAFRKPNKTYGTLLKARMIDLHTLIKLRGGDMVGHRTYTLYTYAYHALKLYDMTHEQIYNEMEYLNSLYQEPLTAAKVFNTFQSAVNRPIEWYIKSNINLIADLGIKADEQKHLKVTIDSTEKRRRRVANHDKEMEIQRQRRRQQGIRPIEEYQQERKEEQQTKFQQLAELMDKHPSMTNAQLAESMGVSLASIKRYKKALKEQVVK